MAAPMVDIVFKHDYPFSKNMSIIFPACIAKSCTDKWNDIKPIFFSYNAGPLVLETLTNACNQSTDILKPAEKQLQDWEHQPGFYMILSEIFCKQELDVNVRWLAVMYTKNGIERYWRKHAPNAIRDEEKEMIKGKLLSSFSEPVPQLKSCDHSVKDNPTT